MELWLVHSYIGSASPEVRRRIAILLEKKGKDFLPDSISQDPLGSVGHWGCGEKVGQMLNLGKAEKQHEQRIVGELEGRQCHTSGLVGQLC